MQPVRGPGLPLPGPLPREPAAPVLAPDGDPQLTTAQRTNLERIVNKIMALSGSKPAEIWAALYHQLHIDGDSALTARQFSPAEQLLLARLSQVQETHAGRQLMQQLSERLSQGNNRQAVSDYIRREFGHTVLSQLDAGQLRQVLTLLQNGELNIPLPQQAAITDRTLLPAEHHALSQLVTRLAAVNGETPADMWGSMLTMMGLKSGDPIPARHFPLLNQFLQAHLTLAQHSAPTLHQVLMVLKQPTNSDEQQAIEAYCQQHFAAGNQTVLSAPQVSAVMQFLFIHRLARTQSQHQTPDVRLLQPAMNPLIATTPVSGPAKPARSPLLIALAVVVVLMVIWLVA